MTKNRWVKFFQGDFLSGIRNLNAMEVAAYIIVLCEIYDHEGMCARDDAHMSRSCRMRQNDFTRALNALIAKGKINVHAGMLTNKRASEEVQKRTLPSRENARTSIGPAADQPRTSREESEKPNGNNGRGSKREPYTELRNRKEKIAETLDDLRKRLGAEPLPPLSERAAAIGSRRAH